jgi:hypothetical protein
LACTWAWALALPFWVEFEGEVACFEGMGGESLGWIGGGGGGKSSEMRCDKLQNLKEKSGRSGYLGLVN